jgi:tetratricopeptide (TPR) repeat protein
MDKRIVLIGGGILAAIGYGLSSDHRLIPASRAESLPEAAQKGATGEESLPFSGRLPRIAQGEDYDRCLGMLNTDPQGAHAFADAWEATGGGDGATHCRALAEITLGAPEKGAEMMETLANAGHGQAAARAGIYGQAGQAWLMAGEPGRAFGAATLALSLAPDDPGLLIDRSVAAASLERYEDAVDDLTRALDLDPRRADALVFRSAAWRHLNQTELAQDDIDRAFVLDAENADALLERGILRQRRGDREGARQDWEHVIALAPSNATGELAQQNLALLEAGPSRR